MFSKPRLNRSSLHAMLLAAIAAFAASAARESHAQGIVDLRLVGPATPIIPGQTFEVKLRAERQNAATACSFSALDCIVGWDPTHLEFLGITTTGSVPLLSSYLPTPANDYTGINELALPQDGNLLYSALAPLGQPRQVTTAGVQVVTFRFKSRDTSTFTLSSVFIIDNLNISYPAETVVYDGVTPGVDNFGIGYAAAIDQIDCSTVYWYRDSDGDGAGDPSDSTTSCTQPAGFVSSSNDLCPTNASLLSPVTYYTDADADGFGALAAPGSFCLTSAPTGYVANSSDCDDAAVIYTDGDGDTFGAGPMVACNGVSSNTDCNDADSAVYPGALENCANLAIDNDCDGSTADAEAVDSLSYYTDGDSDGFGASTATAVKSCSAISGSVTNNSDCDDAAVIYTDGDADGFGAGPMVACNGVSSNTDCDDSSNAVYPGAPELCATDTVDNDCDLNATEIDANAADKVDFYRDQDLDGFSIATSAKFCPGTSNAGYIATLSSPVDCDDASNAAYPGAAELCATVGVDNNCDSNLNDVDANASDKIDFYRDQDLDGFSISTTAQFCPGTSNAGYLATLSNPADCDDTSNAVYPGAPELCADLAIDNDCDGSVLESEATDRSTWYEDADNDNVGDASVSVLACSQPTGYVASSGDACPSDPKKLAPLGCGCGFPDTDGDLDGNPDCFGAISALSMSADQSVYAPGEQVTVRVSSTLSGTGLRSANLSLVFDPTQLELVSVAPVAGSAYSVETSEVVDNIAGTLRYVVSVAAADPANTGAAALADLVFNIRPSAAFCSSSGLVAFGTVGGASTSMSTTTTVPMIPSKSDLGAISFLSTLPVLSGVPADISVAADAGTLAGAFITDPGVTALDACSGAAFVDLAIAYAGGGSGAAWPATGMFPIGTSTVVWTATDSVGQTSSLTRTITVANHQLLDVAVSMFGQITQNSTRTIRVTVGGASQTFEMPLNAGAGSITGIQVPVATSLPCVAVKDPEHSVSKTGAGSVSGVRYAASVVLRQGDSNDDNIVDVLDFGIFVGDRGVDATRRGISNFNSDPVVNNGDFQFISLSFFQVGETCGAFDGPGRPISRISVKELRRRGMGELAQADINRDGWLDLRDIQLYMQGIEPMPLPAN